MLGLKVFETVHQTVVTAFFVITGFVLLALATVGVPSGHVVLQEVFGVFGMIGFALLWKFGDVVQGLTAEQRKILGIVSLALISVGGITIPSSALQGLPWYTSFVLVVLGAIGLGIERALGVASIPAMVDSKNVS